MNRCDPMLPKILHQLSGLAAKRILATLSNDHRANVVVAICLPRLLKNCFEFYPVLTSALVHSFALPSVHLTVAFGLGMLTLTLTGLFRLAGAMLLTP